MAERTEKQRNLYALAYRQSGYFTAAQAVELGFSYQAQKYHVDSGSWMRVERGIFRLRGWPAEIEDVFVLWSLWSRGRGVISHASALAIHDLGVLDPGVVYLTVPPGFRAKAPAVQTVIDELADDDVEDRIRFRVTTPLRTVLDIAKTETQETVDEAVSEALSRGIVTRRALLERADSAGDRAALRVERALAGAEE